MIGREWKPYRTLDSLTIVWRCPNGHTGQWNDVGMLIPPEGHPPENLPQTEPLAAPIRPLL